MTVSIENFVNVSTITGAPTLSAENPNVLAIFSNETAGFGEEFRIYLDATSVGTDFGTASTTYKMAQAAFAQDSNGQGLKAGGGYLVVIPMEASNATPTTVSNEVLTKLTNFQAVTDGSIKFTIGDGTATTSEELRKLDFSEVTTVKDIAAVISAKSKKFYVEADGDNLVFKTRIEGADVTLVNNATTVGTDIGGATLFDAGTATTTAGTDSGPETIQEAITRLDGSVAFHGIVTTKIMDVAEKIATSDYIQTTKYLWFAPVDGMAEAELFADVVRGKSNTRTRCLGFLPDSIETLKFTAGYAAVAFSVNPDGVNTALTMQLKTIYSVVGNEKITDTDLLLLEQYGVDTLIVTQGLSKVATNNANKYFDIIYLADLATSLVKVGVFNAFARARKIPQTAEGRLRLKTTVNNSLAKLLTAGFLATGEQWNGDTFGNSQDFLEAIRISGRYVYLVEAATQEQRESRKAVIQVAIKASGAFHSADISILLEE